MAMRASNDRGGKAGSRAAKAETDVRDLPCGYHGETRDGHREGYGTYTYRGARYAYQGQWTEGRQNGHGKLIQPDGSYCEGNFKDGQLEGHGYHYHASTGNHYTGEWQDGEKCGTGIMEYGNGDRYQGNWWLGQRHGEGELKEANGASYVGSFANHRRHGQGRQVFSNGDCYTGQWENGCRCGNGTLTMHDGTMYEGGWLNDQHHGLGTLLHRSGIRYKGIWENGTPSVVADHLVLTQDNSKPIELKQDSPFTVELHCCDSSNQIVRQESGRTLRVSAIQAIKIKSAGKGSKQSQQENAELENSEQTIETPFGFQGKPYKVANIATDELSGILDKAELSGILDKAELTRSPDTSPSPDKKGKIPRSKVTAVSRLSGLMSPQQALAVRSSAQLQARRSSSPARTRRGTTKGSAGNLKSSSATSFYTNLRAEIDAATALISAVRLLAKLPNADAVHTQDGAGQFCNLFLPPLDPPETEDLVKEMERDSKSPTPSSSPTRDGRRSRSPSHPNTLRHRQDSNSPTSMRRMQTSRARSRLSVPRVEGTTPSGRLRLQKPDLLCQPGDYALLIEDATEPPFLGVHLPSVYVWLRVLMPSAPTHHLQLGTKRSSLAK